MKTLEEFNNNRRSKHNYNYNNNPEKNGISCPECGKELYDSNPMATLTSDPPQKNIHCDCGYTGYRIA